MKTSYAGSSTLPRKNLSNQQDCPSNDSMCPLCYHLPGLLMAFVLPTLPLSSLVCMSAPYSVKICACAVCMFSRNKETSASSEILTIISESGILIFVNMISVLFARLISICGFSKDMNKTFRVFICTTRT